MCWYTCQLDKTVISKCDRVLANLFFFTHIQFSFKDEIALYQHGSRLVCNRCGKRFTQHCSLRRHYESMHIRKCDACTFCGRQFNYSRNMPRNIKNKHEDVLPQTIQLVRKHTNYLIIFSFTDRTGFMRTLSFNFV